MKKIRETVTALTSGDTAGVVHINRKEHSPMSDERFALVTRSVTKIIIAIAGAVVVLNVDIWELVALIGFGVAFTLIYFGLKD